MERVRFSAAAVALFAVFVAAMFLATAVSQVVAVAQSSTNTMRVIVTAGESPQALNDVMKSMKDLGASNVKKLQIINAVSGMVSATAYDKLKAKPEVRSIAEDGMIKFEPVTDGVGDGVPPAGKPDAVSPDIEPEALNLTHSDWGQSLGYSGQGIKVAVLDTGVDTKHPDLAPAVAAYIDTTGTGLKDNGGHGTACASMIAAQGNYVYNSEVGMYMRVKGMAPDAKIYAAKIADKTVGWESNMIAAIEWAVANDVDIISCSFGTYDLVSAGTTPSSYAFKAAVDAGVTVFISQGNEGPGAGTVHDYSITEGVIGVGASTMNREFSQIAFLMPYGNPWKNSQVILWSSRAPSSNGKMSPDIMAPGAFGWALSPTYYLSATGMKGIQEFGGTSQSAPVAAGCAALLMSAYKKEISNTLPSPAYWEDLIRSTATNLGYPGFDQTSGLINVTTALDVMLERKTGFLVDNNEWATTAGSDGMTVTVNGNGVATQKVTVTPTEFVEMTGSTITWTDELVYAEDAEHMFTVPEGTDFIQVDSIWSSGGPFVSFRNAVYDSDGAFVTYAPTYGGYGHLARAQVSLNGPDPPAVNADEQWRVWVFPRASMMPATETVVKTKVTFMDEKEGGWISASTKEIDVTADGSATFKLDLNDMAPAKPGSYFAQVRVSNGLQTTTIPVLLTVPLDVSSGVGEFDGTITGSTVEYVGGEFYYYSFDVPSGTSNILATVKWPNEGNLVWIWLISPDNKLVVFDGRGNSLNYWTDVGGLGRFDTTITQEQVVWDEPMAGKWTLCVNAAGFRGVEFEETYTGKVVLNAGLYSPTSISFSGKPGDKLTADVTLDNPGYASMDVFGMAAEAKSSAMTMSAKGTIAPSHNAAEDKYLLMVAPNTESIDLDIKWMAGQTPIGMSVFDPAFSVVGSTEVDVFGERGDGYASMVIVDPMPGLWTVYVDYYATGHFEPVTYYLTATIKMPGQCPWMTASASPGTPVTVEPDGGTATLTVTARVPTGAMPGTYEADLYLLTATGDRLGVVHVTLTVSVP